MGGIRELKAWRIWAVPRIGHASQQGSPSLMRQRLLRTRPRFKTARVIQTLVHFTLRIQLAPASPGASACFRVSPPLRRVGLADCSGLAGRRSTAAPWPSAPRRPDL
ncbi:hypothetical protein CHELA40_14559 [Chelatococcus asaccharovorans]|nr:hypothetical protein CHELA17_61060 [Chelatococcus asaccharovorans]CAH1678379.1 hypothetical protein CHELA40_14559 [Chelatococcus asaccharovorans]